MGATLEDDMRSAAECCTTGFDTVDATERKALMMACQQTYTFDALNSKCTLTSVNAGLNTGQTFTDNVNINECCQAGFDATDPTQKAALLEACVQSYNWAEDTGSCSLVS